MTVGQAFRSCKSHPKIKLTACTFDTRTNADMETHEPEVLGQLFLVRRHSDWKRPTPREESELSDAPLANSYFWIWGGTEPPKNLPKVCVAGAILHGMACVSTESRFRLFDPGTLCIIMQNCHHHPGKVFLYLS